jgi:flagellar biosynthesis protein FlhB
VAFSSLFLDPVYNKYAFLVHKHMSLNKYNALQYDEPGGLAPTITANTQQKLQITIQQIPTMASVPIPTVQATPLACPNS